MLLNFPAGVTYAVGLSGATYTPNSLGQCDVSSNPNDALGLINAGFSPVPSGQVASGVAPAAQLNLLLARNLDGTVIDATGGAGKFSASVTLGTKAVLIGEASKANNKTDDAIWDFILPASYRAATAINVTVNAQLVGTGTAATKTLQVKFYRCTTGGTQSADLGSGTTGLTGGTAATDYVFSISPAALNPGDRVIVQVEAITGESGGSNNLQTQVNSVRLQ